MLLKSGAKVNEKIGIGWQAGMTPFHMAAWKGHRAVVELLIKLGADINAQDNDAKTFLRIAIEKEKNDIAELLRQNGGTEGCEIM